MNLRITGLFVAAFLVMSVAITAAMRCDDNAKNSSSCMSKSTSQTVGAKAEDADNCATSKKACCSMKAKASAKKVSNSGAGTTAKASSGCCMTKKGAAETSMSKADNAKLNDETSVQK